MIQISAPTMPRRLYRYRPLHSEDNKGNRTVSDEKLQREIKAIRENYLWFSPFEKLNDPMEGIFGMTATAASAPDGKVIPQKAQNVMRQMGICCFSDTRENDVMWVHYAVEHRGICVKYSAHDLRDGLPNVCAARVQYDIQVPIFGAEETSDLRQAGIKGLSSKKSDWHYEREWRLLTNPEAIHVPGSLNIQGQNPVKGIFFGSRTESDVIEAFRKGLSGVRNDTIRFYRPTSLDNRYKYRWEEI